MVSRSVILTPLDLVADRLQLFGISLSFAAQKKNPRPTVLWCYKKDLGFTSNRKKREGKVKRDIKRGQREVGEMDPFELFVSVTDVRYT